MKLLLLLVPVLVLGHPRLFLNETRLSELRRGIGKPGHQQSAWRSMEARLLEGVSGYGGRGGYAKSIYVRELAFAAQLTGKAEYCRTAHGMVLAAQTDEDRADTGYGLSRAMMSMGFAMAYDWCYPMWGESERETVRGILKRAADAWPEFRHANVDSAHKGSNWAAVTRGGELILHLAARGDGDYGQREDRVELCLRDLAQHMKTAYGEFGWTQEGTGYLEYTFGFLAPAVLAARDVGRPELFEQMRKIRWWQLAELSLSFRAGHNMLQSGVSGEASTIEGMSSLMLELTPAEHLPGYVYWYDRHTGRLSPKPHYDGRRAGTIWAMLYYPDRVEPKAPAVEAALDGAKGAFFFRNRYRDANDILLSLVSRNDHHSHAWHQAETYQISLMAFDSSFAIGPVKERDVKLYSKPFVDGKPDVKVGLGRTLSAKATADGGGVVELEAGENFGIAQARRRFAVSFPGEGRGVIEIEDDFSDRVEHDWVWQMRPGAGVSVEVKENEFTLRGKNGTVTGIVKGATVEGGDLLRFRAERGLATRVKIRLELQEKR